VAHLSLWETPVLEHFPPKRDQLSRFPFTGSDRCHGELKFHIFARGIPAQLGSLCLFTSTITSIQFTQNSKDMENVFVKLDGFPQFFPATVLDAALQTEITSILHQRSLDGFLRRDSSPIAVFMIHYTKHEFHASGASQKQGDDGE
jgi:hypothetical protein